MKLQTRGSLNRIAAEVSFAGDGFQSFAEDDHRRVPDNRELLPLLRAMKAVSRGGSDYE